LTEEGDAFFNIDSRLLLQLGEKLVANRAVALAELVKNSYDADATFVEIKLIKVKNRGGAIVIRDNGLGMTLDIFKKTWMRIATTDKEENPISKKYKRKKAGEKGIGRFACRRLSKKLKLISIAENEYGNKEEVKATFNWPLFVPGSDVDKIAIKYEKNIVDKNRQTGTTLILEETNDAWTGHDIRRLRLELIDLISPVVYKQKLSSDELHKSFDPGFEIKFECPEFPAKELSLDKTFFENAWAKLTAYVDNKGKTKYRIQTIKKILQKIDKQFERTETFNFLKNANLEVYIFTYRSDFFASSEWTLTKAEKIGAERGGIKVYSDNFRVFAYGEKGDDWLRTDYDRGRSVSGVDEEVSEFKGEDERPGLRLFRSNNLFGYVIFIKDDNPDLEITVNRERLITNDAFEELRKFVRLGIDFATVLYASEITLELKEKKENEIEEEEKRRIAEETVKKETDELRKKAEEDARKVREELKKVQEERRNIEQERRKIEEERRRAEQEARLTAKEEAKKKAEDALKKEKELLEAEQKLIELEGKAQIAEEKATSKSLIDRKKAEEQLKYFQEKELRRKEDKLKEEFSMLRVLASTGTLILILEHELQSLIEDMDEMNKNFSSLIKKLPKDEKEKYNDDLESFRNRIEMTKELYDFLGLTVGKESRLEKKQWVLFPIVENVFRPFKWYFSEFGIQISNTVPDDLRTSSMYRSELVSILHNLLTNALKAVKGEQDRRIEVTSFKKNDMIHVWFLDSGKGLDKKLWESVFDPFVSYSEPDIRFGVGTGLGLKIVRDFVRSYGGNVRFIDPPKSWKTCVEILLPAG